MYLPRGSSFGLFALLGIRSLDLLFLGAYVITITCHLDKDASVGSWTFFSPAICYSVSELMETLADFVAEDAKDPA